jgi:hypothetical protein
VSPRPPVLAGFTAIAQSSSASLYGEVLSLGVTEFVQSVPEGVEHGEGWIGKLGQVFAVDTNCSD